MHHALHVLDTPGSNHHSPNVAPDSLFARALGQPAITPHLT